MKDATDTLKWLIYGDFDGLTSNLSKQWMWRYLDLLL